MEVHVDTLPGVGEPLYTAHVQLDMLAADVKLVSKTVCIILNNLVRPKKLNVVNINSN